LNVKNLNANSRSRRSKKKKLPEHLAKKWSQLVKILTYVRRKKILIKLKVRALATLKLDSGHTYLPYISFV